VFHPDLDGNKKLKLLEGLPVRFAEFLVPNSAATHKAAWQAFKALYDLMRKVRADGRHEAYMKEEPLKDAELLLFRRESMVLLAAYCSLPDGGGGRLDATPYMHWLVHHCATAMKREGPASWYSCQANEKNNSTLRFFVRRKCNFVNVVEEAVLYELGRDLLGCFERRKRTYAPEEKVDGVDHDEDQLGELVGWDDIEEDDSIEIRDE
jgi:hypothetical protein